MGERAGERGGIGTYRNRPSSVVVQGAEGQLGRNCSKCGQVACCFVRPSGAHLGVLQSAKALACEPLSLRRAPPSVLFTSPMVA